MRCGRSKATTIGWGRVSEGISFFFFASFFLEEGRDKHSDEGIIFSASRAARMSTSSRVHSLYIHDRSV